MNALTTTTTGVGDGFERSRPSRETFELIIGWLDGPDSTGMDHGTLEEHLQTQGRDLLCGLLQDHFDLRAGREARLDDVCNADGVEHRRVEAGHPRRLCTLVGEVTVTRLAYRQPGHRNLYPTRDPSCCAPKRWGPSRSSTMCWTASAP